MCIKYYVFLKRYNTDYSLLYIKLLKVLHKINNGTIYIKTCFSFFSFLFFCFVLDKRISEDIYWLFNFFLYQAPIINYFLFDV